MKNLSLLLLYNNKNNNNYNPTHWCTEIAYLLRRPTDDNKNYITVISWPAPRIGNFGTPVSRFINKYFTNKIRHQSHNIYNYIIIP